MSISGTRRVGRPALHNYRCAFGSAFVALVTFAIAAVLTPPDVVSQLLLGIPLCLLYELSIAAIWFTQRRQKAKEDRVEGNPIL